MTESLEGSLEGSVGRIAPYGLLRDGTGLDGESGYERDHLSVSDAHARKTPKSLAYATPCRYCDELIYLALCRDGRWRTFDTRTIPAAPTGVWAWRKHHGMEEQELVTGKRLHYCSHYNRPNLAPWDRR